MRKDIAISRRTFLGISLSSLPLLGLAEAYAESEWLKVRHLKLGDAPRHRLVHITDIHYKGDREYLEHVVGAINRAAPEAVLFTGDLIEERRYLEDALAILKGIEAPLIGVPGNHDFWSKAPQRRFADAFEKTGGAWLMNESIPLPHLGLTLSGALGFNLFQPDPPPRGKHILLVHYPAFVKRLHGPGPDLILAGHSHGGQVRLPLVGPLILPYGVEEYDLGLYRTPAGPLFVSAGVGWWQVPFRFCCRPELALIEI